MNYMSTDSGSDAQAVFLLERGQTDKQTCKQTDATERPTHACGYTAGVSKYLTKSRTRRYNNL